LLYPQRMPLDPRAQRFLDMTAVAPATAGRPPLSERRRALEKLMTFAAADRLCRESRDGHFVTPTGELPYRLYTPDHAATLTPGLVFFHGGGMVAGSIATHDLICRALAEETGCCTVSVGYRLAPEHPFPAAIEDALAAVREVAAHGEALGIDGSQLALCGDSAGATLATLACQKLRGEIDIALQCLICPVLDFGAASASRQDFAQGYLIDQVTLEADLADYLPAAIDRTAPEVSPLRAADLGGLPRAIIHTAEFDPLRDEGNAYAARLKESGVAVQHRCHPGMLHNFHALGAILPQGRAVLTMIGSQIKLALIS
jgi:acetyl esterase/lipase